MKKVEVTIKDKKLVPIYQAYVIDGLSIKSSSKEIQDRLKSLGVKVINNIVDATNYVTLEMGQPLHAFDLESLEGGVVMRGAKKGEKLVTLDGKSHSLESGDIVIENNGELIDLVGIMGGSNSAISDSTKSILLQAAIFDPGRIRRTSKSLKHQTSASYIYERGLDPELPKKALDRVVELIGGNVLEKIELGSSPKEKKIKFDFSSLEQVSEKKAKTILKNLGFFVSGNVVNVPSWRLDINIPEDISEEIYRLYGYGNIKSEMPILEINPPLKDELQDWKWKIRDVLVSAGYTEVYNYSYGDEGELKIEGQNKKLRVSLLPALEEDIEKNSKNFKEVRIFEIGKVYNKKGEKWMLCIGGNDYLEVKGVLEYLFGEILVPDRVAEFDLEELIKKAPKGIDYKSVPKFPAVKRDIAVMVPVNIGAGEVIKIIEKSGGKLLVGVELFDLYEPNKKEKSLAFHLTYQDSKKTLTDKEINKLHEGVESTLKKEVKGSSIR